MTAPASSAPWAENPVSDSRPSRTWIGYLGVALMLPSFFHMVMGALGIFTDFGLAERYLASVDGGWGFTFIAALFMMFPGYLLTLISMLAGSRKKLFLAATLLANLLVAVVVLYLLNSMLGLVSSL